MTETLTATERDLYERLIVAEREKAALAQLPKEAAYHPLRLFGEQKALDAMFDALAKAQAEFDTIAKDAEGIISYENKEAKTGGRTFNYADLGTIFAAVKPALSKYGLALMMPLALTKELSRVTIILSGHGARVESDVDVPWGDNETMKQFGGNITYMRRYAIQAFLAIAGESDADDKPANEAPTRNQTAPAYGGQRGGQNWPNNHGQRQPAQQGTQQARQEPQQRQATHAAPAQHQRQEPPAAAAQQALPQTTQAPAKSEPPPAAEPRIKCESEAELMEAMKPVRAALWSQDPAGKEAFSVFVLEHAGKPFRQMNLDDGNRLLVAMRAEQARRKDLDEAEVARLFSGVKS